MKIYEWIKNLIYKVKKKDKKKFIKVYELNPAFYYFHNILWCFDKPYSRNEIIRASIVTSHFIIKNRNGNKNHNKRQKIRFELCKSKGIKYPLDLKGES